ncbi:hypothetical protein C1M56_11710 [Vibrio diazotrophicus]|nr:hypothetical protein C1M56_11710 [Vibrio diazotrophicus]
MKLYAIYFPQFYVTKENSRWWGNGFTDWDLVENARPLFKEHYQPRVPKLGYLDQSLSSTIIKQVELAKANGIDGFNFYHYWFDDKPYLEKPVDNFLQSKVDSFEFFFTWANESWTRQWIGKPNEYLLKQNYYTNNKSIEKHYKYLSFFFLDPRYKKIDNKPVYCIYRPELIPNLENMMELFSCLSQRDGFDGVYFIAFRSYDILNDFNCYRKFNAIVNFNPRYSINKHLNSKRYNKYLRLFPEFIQLKLAFFRSLIQRKSVFNYKDYVESLYMTDSLFNNIPVYDSVFPDWDNTARYNKRATLFNNVSSELFYSSLEIVATKQSKHENKMIFINAWNEWSESAYLEPDMKYSYSSLQVVSDFKTKIINRHL